MSFLFKKCADSLKYLESKTGNGNELVSFKFSRPKTTDLRCIKCSTMFDSVSQLRNHFKTISHQPILSQNKDSDSNNAECHISINGMSSILVNDTYYLVWNCWLSNPKSISSMNNMERLKVIEKYNGGYIIIIIFKAGKFSGGIFDESGNSIVTKTFKRHFSFLKLGTRFEPIRVDLSIAVEDPNHSIQQDLS